MKFPSSIVIGSDHAGFELKQNIMASLSSNASIHIIDVGTNSSESCDYPDYAHALAKAIEQGQAAFGILICGSGEGVCITANRHKGIRAALCWLKDIAQLSRQHNDANVICLPARFVTPEQALEMVYVFMTTDFEGGRHQRRVEKIELD